MSKMKELKAFQKAVHENAITKGWWDRPSSNGENFMLMVSELAEACEADRLGNPSDDKIPEFSGIEAELGDVIIRILDFAEAHQFNVIDAMLAKAEMNKTRSYKHDGKRY